MRALILMTCGVAALAAPLAAQNPQMRRQLQQQVVERGFASLGPVAYVVRVAEAHPTPREPASLVAVGQRPAQSGRDDARLAAQIEDIALRIVGHDHLAGVAGDALGRSRGNVGAVLEGRLAGMGRSRGNVSA